MIDVIIVIASLLATCLLAWAIVGAWTLIENRFSEKQEREYTKTESEMETAIMEGLAKVQVTIGDGAIPKVKVRDHMRLCFWGSMPGFPGNQSLYSGLLERLDNALLIYYADRKPFPPFKIEACVKDEYHSFHYKCMAEFGDDGELYVSEE